MVSKNVLPAVCIVSGLLFVITGITVGLVALPQALDSEIEKALVINSENDPDYDDWRVLDREDTPKYKIYYLFDVQNSDAVLTGEKPELVEVGPFVYRQLEERINVEFSNGDEVTYGWDTKYFFEPELSVDLDPTTTMLTNINPTYQALRMGASLAIGRPVDIRGGAESVLYASLAAAVIADLDAGFSSLFTFQVGLSALGPLLEGHILLYPGIVTTQVLGAELGAPGGTLDNARVDLFFNDPTWSTDDGIGFFPGIAGISALAGTPLGFTPESMLAVLVQESEDFPGILVAVPGAYNGIQGFLGAYQALAPGGAPALGVMAAAYQVTPVQLDAVFAFCLNFVTAVVPTVLGGDPTEKAIEQWRLGSFPTSSSTNGVKAIPTWTSPWEIFPVIDNLSQDTARQLLNSSALGSLTNPDLESGLGIWAVSQDTSQPDDVRLRASGLLQISFGLTLGQVIDIFERYIAPTTATLLEDVVAPTFNVTTAADIGYLQWGTNSVTGPNATIGQEFAELMGGKLNLLCPNRELMAGLPVQLSVEKSRAVLQLRGAEFIGFFTGQVDIGLDEFELDAVQQYFACAIFSSIASAGIDPTKLMFSTRTIEEWLWSYDDPLLRFVEEPNTDSSFFSNSSIADPPSTYNTGAKDIQKLQEYVNWQGQTVIEDVYLEPEYIRGTPGTQWGPRVKKGAVLETWVSEFLRTVDLVYERDVQVEGIDVRRYVLSPALLEVNERYLTTIAGLQDLSQIGSYGPSPLYASKPHFYDADESLLDMVTGLSPDKDKHDTVIDVEPITGAGLRIHKRLQLSVNIGPTDLVHPNFASAVVPILWADETGQIEPDDASDFKSAVYTIERVAVPTAIYGGAGLGAFCLIFGVTRLVYLKRRGTSDADVALSNLGY